MIATTYVFNILKNRLRSKNAPQRSTPLLPIENAKIEESEDTPHVSLSAHTAAKDVSDRSQGPQPLNHLAPLELNRLRYYLKI